MSATETRNPITETCADCNWPDVCLKDATCWNAVQTEREDARQERVSAARAARKDRKENAMEGLADLGAMDRGERVNGDTPAPTNECKIPGCDEPWLSDRGRFAKLCETHKAEALARAKAEGSLGSKKKRESKLRPAPTSDSWDDLRALVAGLFAHTFVLTRCEDGTEQTALQDRLVAYLEAQGLADRRSA